MRFVLGGSDTEMKAIQVLAMELGHTVILAQREGKRVTRGYAYDADYPKPKLGDIWVECQHKDYSKTEMFSLGVEVVDHHYEGDPGYGKPPAEYWEASSIGQVYGLLNLEPTEKARFIAAGDHCLYAAYHSMCPGVDKKAFIEHRMAFFRKNKTEEAFNQKKKQVIDVAKSCKKITLGKLELVDLTPLMESHSGWMSDVSCMLNLKFATIKPHRNKEWVKYFVGNLSRKEIRYFMEELVPTMGEVITVYGDPTRQFAGAVICLSE